MTCENNDNRKRVIVQLRTTKEEKEKLKVIAKEAGMNVTDFIKVSTLNKPPRIRKATFDREILIRLLAELGKVGSNINQIAKAMNSEKNCNYTITIKETVIVEVLAQLNILSSAILNELEHGGKG